jgi:hypothetical protein
MLIGLLAVSITSNNFLTKSTWGQKEISDDAETDSIPITSAISLDSDICDISEGPVSKALLERLRDRFCDIDRDSSESDDEINHDARGAQNDEDDQGNGEDVQGTDEENRLVTGEGVQKKLQELRDRLEKVLSEEEVEDQPLPADEQKKVEQEDQLDIKEHKAENDKDCKDGNVLEGASNEVDLKILSTCQEVAGEVVHTKKMNDGDYKFLLDVDDKYKYLLNEKNDGKTDGYLVVEIVPPDQDSKDILLPKEGDTVHLWGAWVTDQPKGWHEIHPAWKVIKQ